MTTSETKIRFLGCFLESTLLRRKHFDRNHCCCSDTSDLRDNNDKNAESEKVILGLTVEMCDVISFTGGKSRFCANNKIIVAHLMQVQF